MAVYTDVTAEDLDCLLGRYAIGRLVSVKGIVEGVENSNFFLETERGRYILTLYEKRVEMADLPFFLGLMEHLSTRGVTCPVPVHDTDGRVLQSVAGRPAAIVTFLPGYSLRKPLPVHCRAVGDTLARMHSVGHSFGLRRENALALPGWRRLFDKVAKRADQLAQGLSDSIDHQLRRIETHWPEALPQGVIHADLFPDNVFFLETALSGVIDFYFACNDLFSYDLAICMNAWCFEADHSFNVTKAKALIGGYSAVRPLLPGEIEAFPILASGASLRFLLTRLYDWFNTPATALVKRKDPLEYWRKMLFHGSIRSPSAYGI